MKIAMRECLVRLRAEQLARDLGACTTKSSSTPGRFPGT